MFALVGLYLYLEKGCSGKAVQQAHMHLARRRNQWPDFAQPAQRGTITVADVVAVPPGSQCDEAIRKWCASVWSAYCDSHNAVAELVHAELPEFSTQSRSD